MSDEMKSCPNCNSPYGYSLGNEIYACPECYNEWNPNEKIAIETPKILDVNGNQLNDGDAVIVILKRVYTYRGWPLNSTDTSQSRTGLRDGEGDRGLIRFGWLASSIHSSHR